MIISPTPFIRKFTLNGLLFILAMGFLPQTVQSQVKEHSFKITGLKENNLESSIISILNAKTLVVSAIEYDSLSADHLYISNSSKGLKIDNTCYLFKGKKFNLTAIDTYLASKELLKDGIQKVYAEDESLQSELIFKEGVLLQQTSFYSNGNKQIMFFGDEKALNGSFKMWHPNGQLSFSGNYINNLKDGVFESFDASGMSERKGTYREGKLIEGLSVVQDFVYDTPEVGAQYLGNDSILNIILLKKTANLADVREMDSSIHRVLDLKFTIAKTGKIKKLDITNSTNSLDIEVIQAVFSKQFMNFQPALLEGAPVSSYFTKSFILSNKGLQVYVIPSPVEKDFDDKTICAKPEVMPEFPGGEKALLNFLIHTILYPREAAENGIQGKVFVSFVILVDGTVSDVSILRGVHPLLNAEAYRVVKAMPKWIPARNAGKTVNASYTMPINFALE